MTGTASIVFIIPYTIGDYLAGTQFKSVDTTHLAFQDCEKGLTAVIKKLLSIAVKRAVDDYHKELGKIMWEFCGMAPNAAGMTNALGLIPKLREQFWNDVRIPGSGDDFKNTSAMLFVSAKVAHLGRLPQGEAERKQRALSMVAQMDAQGFGACSNTYACEAECPKRISVDNIAFLNREILRAKNF
jgi:succinate dehydrogenase / fumarate reductase, flavoprotein subunit